MKNYQEFFKTLVFIFLLTTTFYPRPLCSWVHSGISCFLLPPILGTLSVLFYRFDFLFVFFISIFTSFTFLYLKSKKIFPLENIKNKKLRKIVLFLFIWIIYMIIFSIPYYLYGRFFHPTGGIE